MAKKKVMESGWTLLIAAIVLGVFSLPLVWSNRRLDRHTKIAFTVLICVLSLAQFLALGWITRHAVNFGLSLA